MEFNFQQWRPALSSPEEHALAAHLSDIINEVLPEEVDEVGSSTLQLLIRANLNGQPVQRVYSPDGQNVDLSPYIDAIMAAISICRVWVELSKLRAGPPSHTPVLATDDVPRVRAHLTPEENSRISDDLIVKVLAASKKRL
jgi:hypothetical protein